MRVTVEIPINNAQFDIVAKHAREVFGWNAESDSRVVIRALCRSFIMNGIEEVAPTKGKETFQVSFPVPAANQITLLLSYAELLGYKGSAEQKLKRLFLVKGLDVIGLAGDLDKAIGFTDKTGAYCEAIAARSVEPLKPLA